MLKPTDEIEEKVEEKKELVEKTEVKPTDEIEVGDPMLLRPIDLPLVVKLPEGASKAQIKYAKTLNGYAYKNPQKWALKKDKLIEKLKELKNAPDPIESNLKINNSGL